MEYKDISKELELADHQLKRLIDLLPSVRQAVRYGDETAVTRIRSQIIRCIDSSVELALSIAVGTKKKLPPFANLKAFDLAIKNGLTLESDVRDNLSAFCNKKHELINAEFTLFNVHKLIDFGTYLVPLLENFLSNCHLWRSSKPKDNLKGRLINFFRFKQKSCQKGAKLLDDVHFNTKDKKDSKSTISSKHISKIKSNEIKERLFAIEVLTTFMWSENNEESTTAIKLVASALKDKNPDVFQKAHRGLFDRGGICIDYLFQSASDLQISDHNRSILLTLAEQAILSNREVDDIIDDDFTERAAHIIEKAFLEKKYHGFSQAYGGRFAAKQGMLYSYTYRIDLSRPNGQEVMISIKRADGGKVESKDCLNIVNVFAFDKKYHEDTDKSNNEVKYFYWKA